MAPDEILRLARHRAGLSQRAFAREVGVSSSTVARVETGGTDPAAGLLQRAAASAGLELVLDLPASEVDEAGRAYLRLSLTHRLYRSTGGTLRNPRTDRRPSLWQDLLAWAPHAELSLSGRSALCLWLARPEPLEELAVDAVLIPRPEWALVALPPAKARLQLRDPQGKVGPVRVNLPPKGRLLRAPSPGELAMDPTCSDHRRALRGVARLLDVQAARDRARRRTPAHREPQHLREEEEVFHTKRLQRYPMPPAGDERSWRLDDDASLGAWLRHHGIPG